VKSSNRQKYAALREVGLSFDKDEIFDRLMLPIHFFTLVANGEPFIRYHEHVLAQLAVPWQWHIVEGLVTPSQNVAARIPSSLRAAAENHDRDCREDGTADYLDDLVRRKPDRVTLHRPPRDRFWNSAQAMWNAPLAKIKHECLLWQIDAAELWTVAQIGAVHQMFAEDPSRTAALFWQTCFVGPEKIVSTRHNCAQDLARGEDPARQRDPARARPRTWRFKPRDRWSAHEPPRLARRTGWISQRLADVATINPFTQDETEAVGAAFQRFAYATEAQFCATVQARGLTDGVEKWHELQSHRGSGLLSAYFPWVADATLFDDAAALGITPIARPEDGGWQFTFADAKTAKTHESALPRPRIVVDGYFFQITQSGIARVWLNLLRVWSESGFADHIILLDRAGTAPRIAGLHYIPVAAFDYEHVGSESIRLEEICRRVGADLFVSTYYTTPLTTPSVFMGYDMIPEVFGLDFEEPMWREKRRGIRHACAHIMISMNSAQDLERFMPNVRPMSTIVAYCGVDPAFRPKSDEAIAAFRQRHRLTKPYLLLVGDRTGADGYKNGVLAFKALADLPDPNKYTLLCVGGRDPLEPHLKDLIGAHDVRKMKLTDEDLVTVYAGAHVLIYASRYEGFGLPVVEAMACGCPVVTCRNSSLIEVAGEAALFIGEDDPKELAARIVDLESQDLRRSLRERGFVQAAKFDFPSMAATIEASLCDVHKKFVDGHLTGPGEGWRELREFERNIETRRRTK
jgi:glycosyltransferase involved in cell wall biosynthesis